MKEEQQKKELEIALTSYIALKHNQDECSGFIDGFKEALSLFDVSGRSEQLAIDALKLISTAHSEGWSRDIAKDALKEISNCH